MERERVERLCAGLPVAYPDERFAPLYGRLQAAQARVGRTVATMDLLIATSAVAESATLVTGNVRDFERLPGLDMLRY